MRELVKDTALLGRLPALTRGATRCYVVAGDLALNPERLHFFDTKTQPSI